MAVAVAAQLTWKCPCPWCAEEQGENSWRSGSLRDWTQGYESRGSAHFGESAVLLKHLVVSPSRFLPSFSSRQLPCPLCPKTELTVGPGQDPQLGMELLTCLTCCLCRSWGTNLLWHHALGLAQGGAAGLCHMGCHP